MPGSQYLNRPPFDLKENPIDTVALSNQQFADLDSKVFELGRDSTACRVRFQRIEILAISRVNQRSPADVARSS